MESNGISKPRVYKVVLTGGPCGGKTTGQSRLCTFFENLGWKVYRVPEAANTLLSGGVKFKDLPGYAAMEFQENLLLTMMQIEKTFFSLADASYTNCLVICDRGCMDPAAYISEEKWQGILKNNNLNMVELRDSRYNQIIHMVSAAKGAEDFYTLEKIGSYSSSRWIRDHASRSEGLDDAIALDDRVAQAWIGHPYVDVIDNSTDFENKLARLIKAVCRQCGIDTGDRLSRNAKKRKFLVAGPLPSDSIFPAGFQDFDVIHNYLGLNSNKYQARLRKRGQKGSWSYTHTVRRSQHGQTVEVRNQISHREYNFLLSGQVSTDHMTIQKKRRCFIWRHQYYQLDVYQEPCHPRCKDLMFLEMYTTLDGDEVNDRLPSFLEISKEVTGDPYYSMFNLSLKDDSVYVQKFCHRLAEEDDRSGSFDKLHEITSMTNGE